MPETIESIAQKRRKWVEANQENRFEAGLKRLLTDLYPDNAHFIYELLQNAEDARAQEVRFILHEDLIEFEHDGKRLFSIDDVDAITSIGFSNKRDDATSIGKFGVGFKAVFAYTETPEVESGEFHFQIHDMVVPTPDGLSRGRSKGKQTRFVLPFNNHKKPKDRARTEIESLLRALEATTLLFLTHIRKIEYLLPDTSLGYIERIGLGDHRLEIRVQQPNELVHSSSWFAKFDEEVQVEDDEAENEEHRAKSCRIAVAFGLRPVEADANEEKGRGAGDTKSEWELVPIDPGRVCIYFPADKETSNLRFHLHAPFASTVARDSVRDSAGNNALRDHLAALLAKSLHAIREQGLLSVRALALLPNDKDNLSKFYQPFLTRLVREFQEQALVPMKRGGHAAASGIFRGAKALSDLIDDDDLVAILGGEYVPPMWAANPPQRNQREDNFLSMLEIEEWTDDDLGSALSEMDDESRAAWMGMKSEEWHQRLYAFLEDHSSELTDVEVIRIIDGTYRKGSECFFPTDETENDDQFPRVARGVFSSGKNKEQQTKARNFLKDIGVREVDERVEVEQLLRAYYAYKSEVPNRKGHYSHLRRFMRFLKDNPDRSALFQNAYLFMVDGKVSAKWSTPAEVYLDKPFMDTGLRAYYDKRVAEDRKHPLSTGYKKSGIKPEVLGKFAEGIGAITNLRIEEIEVPHNHPEWANLSRRGGERWTRGTDEDYHIPHLAEFLASPSITKSRLVWRTMKESCRGYWCQYLQARFGRNRSSIATASSTLVHDLRKAMWVPQTSGKKHEFVQPRDAVAERLPDGFEYQTGWQWLHALEFGEGVEERREAQRRENERQSQEYKRKEQVLREVGFDSPEEAEEMARLKKEDPDGFQRWRESRQAKPAFPERDSADPERRKSKALEKAAGAPDKLYEKRERSIRTSRTQGTDGVDEYLRDLYTNEDDQLICQICQDEMPFRKKNGKHYFEKVEAFDLPGEHSANHLALCPVCAAKYDEFVFHGPDDARDKLRDAFARMDGALELPVTLGEESATIRFVQSHAIDLRATVSEK